MTKTLGTDVKVSSGELSLEDLNQASGGFNVGAAVMDAYKQAVAKDLARSQGCLGPTTTIGGTATEVSTGKVHSVDPWN
jgi:hypothetical protein